MAPNRATPITMPPATACRDILPIRLWKKRSSRALPQEKRRNRSQFGG